ncbi:MAG: DUF998 domain-containing protein [Nitrososphaerota archaeon]|nr:DUF998 domain-containing protein [Nitrososphaerota archaeon]
MAFPNAYVSTDEPPRRSAAARALCAAAVGGIGYLGLVILALSLATRGYSPVTQMASDYGVGPYAFWMDSGFFAAGLGFASLGAVLAVSHRERAQRAGGALLVLAGAMLIVNAFNATDVEGAAATFHGTVHNMAGATFFLTAPIGLVLAGRGFGPSWFAFVLAAFAAAALSLAVDSAMGLGAAGLVERLVILVTFGSAVLTAAKVYRES